MNTVPAASSPYANPLSVRIMAVFIVQSLAGVGVYTRIPDFQTSLGLSEGALGLAIMGQPIGAMCMFLVASRLIEKSGTRVALLFGVPLIYLSVLGLSLAPNGVTLFAGFFAFGLTFALTNVAMNVEADRVEAATGQRVMNSCHGLWSLLFVGTALAGATAREFAFTPFVHFAAFAPLVALGWFAAILRLQPSPPRSQGKTGRKPAFAVPSVMTFLLVGYGIAGVLMEGGSRNWSVIFMRDSFDAPAFVETMVLPAFLITMTAGRMLADGWVTRFGPARVAAVLMGIALIGLVLVTLSNSIWTALAGFSLIGFGVCVCFPLTLSAAARLTDRPSSENVAAVSMTSTIVLLGSPAALGFIAEHLGIRATFAALIPFLVLSLFLSRYLAPPEERPGGTS